VEEESGLEAVKAAGLNPAEFDWDDSADGRQRGWPHAAGKTGG